jgi:DNA-binding transcriptional LysR family regulator
LAGCKKICDVAGRLYSSTNYLDSLDRPVTIAKLNKTDFTGFNRRKEMIDALNHFGLTVTQDNFPIVSENHLVQWEMMKQGITIGMMMEVVGDNEPLLERVLPESAAIVFPIWLVAHKQLKSSKRIRAVFDV